MQLLSTTFQGAINAVFTGVVGLAVGESNRLTCNKVRIASFRLLYPGQVGRGGVERASTSDALGSWFEPHSISENTT